jgi:rare lipoprotein A
MEPAEIPCKYSKCIIFLCLPNGELHRRSYSGPIGKHLARPCTTTRECIVEQRKVTLLIASLFTLGVGVATPSLVQAEPDNRSGRVVQSGRASWYGPGFHGRRTASGETFNANALTAAHRTLPFGTRVRVMNKSTGRSVVVRINDRGPYAHGRVIDLSRASAQAIGISGIGSVELAQF